MSASGTLTSGSTGSGSSSVTGSSSTSATASGSAAGSGSKSGSGSGSNVGSATGAVAAIAIAMASKTTGESVAMSAPASISASGIGAQLWQRPSTLFQQLPQVYCRHDRQKLKVWWKASSWWAVWRISDSARATANASSIVWSGLATKLRMPRPTVPRAPNGLDRRAGDSNV
jgi:hypothetical protein